MVKRLISNPEARNRMNTYIYRQEYEGKKSFYCKNYLKMFFSIKEIKILRSQFLISTTKIAQKPLWLHEKEELVEFTCKDL